MRVSRAAPVDRHHNRAAVIFQKGDDLARRVAASATRACWAARLSSWCRCAPDGASVMTFGRAGQARERAARDEAGTMALRRFGHGRERAASEGAWRAGVR